MGLLPDYVGFVFAKSKGRFLFHRPLHEAEPFCENQKRGCVCQCSEGGSAAGGQSGDCRFASASWRRGLGICAADKGGDRASVIKAIRVRNREDILRGEELPVIISCWILTGQGHMAAVGKSLTGS